MFTGIIEEIGSVQSLTKQGRIWRLEIDAPQISKEIQIGDSICVNGVCLTVVSFLHSLLAFELQAETLRCTALGELKQNAHVNLERALSVSSRLSGHFVQGHVDDVGVLEAFQEKGEDVILKVRFDAKQAPYIVPKGSITIDGVSLTVVDVGQTFFTVHLIPHTLTVTTLSQHVLGAKLNVEVDILGKYVVWNLLQRKIDEQSSKTPMA